MTAPQPGGDAAAPDHGGWPFLVATGIRVGIRVVLAPQFLVDGADADAVFKAARTGPGISTIGIQHLTVFAASGEVLTLVFRNVPATAQELGVRVTGGRSDESGTTPLLDAHGRPITLIEGLALRGRYSHVAVSPEEWRRLHEITLAAYRSFLDNEAQGPARSASQQIAIAEAPITDKTGSTVPSAEPSRVRLQLSRRAVLASVAVLAAILIIVVVVIAATSGHSAVTNQHQRSQTPGQSQLQ